MGVRTAGTSFGATSAADFIPDADATYDIGSSSVAWKDLHLSGDVVLGTGGQVLTDGGSAANPAIRLGAENHGFYRAGGSIFNAVVGGTSCCSFAANQIRAKPGSVSVPGLGCTTDYDSGLFFPATGETGLTAAGAEALRVDKSTTAGDTRMLVYDVDSGVLSRVTVGPDDSGMTGYKVLRIPN